jgi:hypothetical protein
MDAAGGRKRGDRGNPLSPEFPFGKQRIFSKTDSLKNLPARFEFV